jgi:hypothetical protein
MTKPSDIPAALDRLDALVGRWETTASFDAGFAGPDTPAMTSVGRTTFEWLDGRWFLVQRFTNEQPVPSGVSIIGTGDEPDTFTQRYYDSRGVERVYQLSLEGRELTIRRSAPGFSQRYRGVISEDGTSITGAWEASDDGREWRHDFALRYAKIG